MTWANAKIKKIYVGTQQVRPDKMPWYQEVEYIQSTGTQYIQTSIVPSNTKWIYIKCSSQSIWDAWVYVGSSWWWNTRFRVVNSQNLMSYWWNTIHNSSWTISENVVYEHKLNYLNSRNITLDWQVVDSNLWTLSSTNNKPIYIFAWNSNWSIYWYSYIKLYSLKISDWSNVVNDFIPCYRISDNVIWLYDTVNSVFYTNSWTGTFTKWADI